MTQLGRGGDALDDEDVDLDLLSPSPAARRRARGADRAERAGRWASGDEDEQGDQDEHRDGPPAPHRPRGAWPEAAPAWLRTPAALLLAVVLAVALTAGLVTRQARSATEAAVAAERALLALDVVDAALSSTASVDPLTGLSVAPQGSPVSASLAVTVVNGGETVAFVTPLGLDLDGLPEGAVERTGDVVATGGGTPRGVSAPVAAVGPLAVAAGGSSRGVVPIAVDCDAVPAPDELGSGRPEQLVAQVRAGGAERVEHLPITAGSGGLGLQLARQCHPEAEVAVRVVSSEITADGGLEVVLQDLGTVRTQVDLAGRPALEVTGDPALPLDLRPGGTTRVVLTGAPDCAAQRDPLVEGLVMRALPVEAADGGSTTPLDAAMTSAWWVRVVALACG